MYGSFQPSADRAKAGGLTRRCFCSPRLYKALEQDGEAAGARDEPFRTYEGLERAAQGRRGKLRSVREALGGAAREQAASAARLEGDHDTLRRAAYSGLQHLVLRPQVCATAAQELCPNSGKLTSCLPLPVRISDPRYCEEFFIAHLYSRGKRLHSPGFVCGGTISAPSLVLKKGQEMVSFSLRVNQIHHLVFPTLKGHPCPDGLSVRIDGVLRKPLSVCLDHSTS